MKKLEQDRPGAGMVTETRPYREFDDGRVRVYGYSYDPQALEQIRTVRAHGWVADAALMADNHLGYSMPIGGVAGYRDMVSPSGVGYDIGCGVMAVRTTLTLESVRKELPRLADEITRRLSFGIGRTNAAPVDHELFDSPSSEPTSKRTGGESISPSLARPSNGRPCASARKPEAVLWPTPREPKWTPTQIRSCSSAIRLT